MPDYKPQGLESEMAFCLAAIKRGFLIAKPMGDSTKYDVILDNGPRLFRVQVKSVGVVAATGYYNVSVRHGGSRYYNRSDIDIVAAHIQPLDLWYIFPVEVVEVAKSVSIKPLADNLSRYSQYEEAWYLFYPDAPQATKPPELPAPPTNGAANAGGNEARTDLCI